MKTYHHSFHVNAPIEAVAAFHRQSASMGAITPPPVIARVHSAPEILGEGDEMAFTLWIGPLPLRWLARIEDVGPAGFLDRQLSGPFAVWEHRHGFAAIDENRTEVTDAITYQPKKHLFWRLVGLGMSLNLPILFAFRGWKTKRLLES